MRLLILIVLNSLLTAGIINAQSVKVYSNTGLLIRDANKVSQGTKFKKNNPTDFILAFRNGYITTGVTANTIFKEEKPEYRIDLKEIEPLSEDYDSKIITFAKFVDMSGKIPTQGTYSYWGYVKGIDLEDSQLLNAINNIIGDFGYKIAGGNNAIFKEKQGKTQLAIAGEITHVAKETKGTPGFKVAVIVKWSVYDVDKEKVIYKLSTGGYSDSQKPGKFKDELVLALKNAVIGLIDSDDFIKLADNHGNPVVYEDDATEVLILPTVSKSELSDYGEIIKNSINSVVTVKTEFGHGSGFIISTDGYALTNNHVVKDAEKIEVIFNNKLTLPAEIIANDKNRDVTLLKIVGGGYQPLPLNLSGETAEIGSEVIAIGTPEDIKLGQSVTKGIVSGYRNLEDKNYIQTDVSINSGNSGGALINTKGEVIGIVVSKIVGNNVEGLGFAIPIEEAVKGLNIKFE